MDASSINVKLTLNDVRLADVLDAIVLVADHPIKYSIEDYGIVFSSKGAEPIQLETRTFRIDANTFFQGLESVSGESFGSANNSSGGNGGGGGGGGGGGRADKIAAALLWQLSMPSPGPGNFVRRVVRAAAVVAAAAVAKALPTPLVAVVPAAGAGGGGGGNLNANGGLRSVTTVNLMTDVSQVARDFFSTLGVNLDPTTPGGQGKSVFFNDRLGVLFVRATSQDLDTIEKAIQVLNMTPPQVHIKARFIEVEQDDTVAMGFDWYLGNVNLGNGVVGTGGNAGSVNVPTHTMSDSGGVSSSGVFPGNSSGNTIPTTVQSLTSGLRNSAPTVATITGILTQPNFQVVIHALEQRTGFENLAEPEVTTTSGRQTQMRATDIMTIITGFSFQQNVGGGITGNGVTTPTQ